VFTKEWCGFESLLNDYILQLDGAPSMAIVVIACTVTIITTAITVIVLLLLALLLILLLPLLY
jgi:hypothetical protein